MNVNSSCCGASGVGLLARVLRDSQAQMQALLKSLAVVDVQNGLIADKMAIAEEIIAAYGEPGEYGGSLDVVA